MCALRHAATRLWPGCCLHAISLLVLLIELLLLLLLLLSQC
jgi:hypothetical protein